jgi:hypothetical protein
MEHSPNSRSHTVAHHSFAAVMPRQADFDEIAHHGPMIPSDELVKMGELRERSVYGLFAEPDWRLEQCVSESEHYGNAPGNGHFDPGFRTDADLVFVVQEPDP